MIRILLVPVLVAVFTVGSGGIPGGPQSIDPNDARAKNAVQVAVVHHNNNQNDMYLRQVVNVNDVKSQVVQGIMYTINVTMTKTTCKKAKVEVCAVPTNSEAAQPYNCIFKVWSRVWLSDIRVTSQTCG